MTQWEDREAQAMDNETAKPQTTVACNGSSRVEEDSEYFLSLVPSYFYSNNPIACPDPCYR